MERSNIPTGRISRSDCRKFVPNLDESCICVSVYDGDTISIASRFKNNTETSEWYQFPVRIDGINTPEIRSNDPKEKRLAVIARDELRALVLDKTVHLIYPLKLDKYGRILCDISIFSNEENKRICVSNFMLKNGFAVPYDGGKKITPKSWLSNTTANEENEAADEN
jgi:endonuclease YncB( thermonuclease family)